METLLRMGLGNAVAAALLALGAASVGVFARGRPALRHGLWILVLLKLVTPPLWTVPVAWVAASSEAAPQARETPDRLLDVEETPFVDAPAPDLLLQDDPETADVVPAGPAAVRDEAVVRDQRPWSTWLLMLWGAGSLLTFGVAAWRIRRFQRFLRLAEPAPEALRGQVEALAGRLGLIRMPTIELVPGAVSPLVWALGCRPRLILPRGLWDRLDERQRNTLLAHELAHLRRRDHWVRGLELLVTALYWWLPVVWIARHALREAEEQCCDAWVVWAFPDATRTYAEALLETLDFLAGAGPVAAVAATGLGPVHHLKRRLTMIMQGTTPRALTWSGLLAVLGLSATLLPLAPTWAQRPDEQEKPAAGPEDPSARDADPQPERPRDTPGAPNSKRETRAFRRDGDGGKEVSEAMERVLAELEELTARKADGELDRALVRLRALVRRHASEAEPGEGKNKADEGRAQSKRRKPEAASRIKPDTADEGPEAKERRAEVAKLKAEVAERQKALMEAHMRLAKAMRQLAGAGAIPGPPGRGERFEFRFSGPGEGPRPPGNMMETRPRPVGPDGRPVGPLAAPGNMMRMPPRPDQDRRIAELEERLEKLQEEVKSLKKDAPEKQ